MAVFGCVGGFLGNRASGMAIVIAAGALVFSFFPYMYVLKKRKKRMHMFEEQFPEALDFLGRALRAGHAFSASLEMLSEESMDPLGLEFRKVFNEQNLGASTESALQNLSQRMPMLDVRFFVSAVLLQKETGGNLSEILSRLAYVIRERFRLKGQVKAASAHGRITGTVLTIMPLVLMALLMVVAPDYLPSMARDEDGRKMIGFAIGGQFLGYLCIRKIVNIKV
jgi:tight adherence protein B